MHCVKSVRIRSYSGLYFPALGLNMERYGISLHIQSECGKIRTRITANTNTFHAVLGKETYWTTYWNSRKSVSTQKQSSISFFRKRCFEFMYQIYRRTPIRKCNFSVEIALLHGCYLVRFRHIFRTPSYKNPVEDCFWESSFR